MTLLRIAIALATLLTACGTNTGNQPAVEPKSCTTRVGSEIEFVGEPRCLAKLPQEELSGYWVSGHEYSVFYSNKEDIKHEPDAQASWLFLSDAANAAVRDKLREGEWQVFAISFLGMRSTARGVYGPGPFKGGVLVARVLHLEEVDAK